jgi:hypothetical protein
VNGGANIKGRIEYVSGVSRERGDNDMMPLTDEEKRAIAESFQLLKTAILISGARSAGNPLPGA